MSDHDQSVGKDDLNKLLLDSVSKGVDELDRHQYKDGEDTKKLFGFIEMDSALANMAEVVYNTFIGSATKRFSPKVYATVLKYGKDHLGTTALYRTAAGATFALNAGVYAMPSITDAYKMWDKQHDVMREKAQRLSPVLDEIKGRHGMAAYHGVSVEQNEMIAYDRWRTAKIHHSKLMGLIIPALAKIAPNIWLHERNAIQAMQRGEDIKIIEKELLHRDVAKQHGETIANKFNQSNNEKIQPSDVTHEHVTQLENNEAVKGAIRNTVAAKKNSKEDGFKLDGFAGVFGSNAALTTIANKVAKSGEHRVQKMFRSAYTAQDMVFNLQDQMGNDPMPRSFQLPNRGRSLSLEAYVAEIMFQHQRDMASMKPDYAEIRDALKENVIAAAKPLAAALAKGDISALSLVSYIGGGKIIRNKGRQIISGDEVEAMIERHAAKVVQQHEVDPKKFWEEAPYDEKEGKAAFAALQGEERRIAIALIPRGQREKFGISEKESKAVDAHSAKEIEGDIAEATLGAAARDDATLREMGLANAEIKHIREDAKKIKADGVTAVHELRSSAAHPNGIDRLLLAVAVGSEIKGEKVRFGTIIEDGRKRLAANDANYGEAANDADYGAEDEERGAQRSHAGREAHHRASHHGASAHRE